MYQPGTFEIAVEKNGAYQYLNNTEHPRLNRIMKQYVRLSILLEGLKTEVLVNLLFDGWMEKQQFYTSYGRSLLFLKRNLRLAEIAAERKKVSVSPFLKGPRWQSLIDRVNNALGISFGTSFRMVNERIHLSLWENTKHSPDEAHALIAPFFKQCFLDRDKSWKGKNGSIVKIIFLVELK